MAMDMAVLEVPKPQAERAFKAYQAAVRERHNAEDEQIMRGYKAILSGKQIISLRKTMTTAGLDAKGYPKLAIIRADARLCWVEMNREGGCTFMDKRWVNDRGGIVSSVAVRVPVGTWPRTEDPTPIPTRAQAIVPNIPPEYRPATGLGSYHILWEAEWSRVPPRDPALLKYVGGDLWAVVATWDLTEVERAVIAGRA